MDHSKLQHVHSALKRVERNGVEVGFTVEKPYKNPAWVMSHDAKQLRILAELQEPVERFESCKIGNTILFFGSARARSPEAWGASLKRAEDVLADPAASEADKKKAQADKDQLKKIEWMVPVYRETQALAKKLTEWSMSRLGAIDPDLGKIPYAIATGGGPGCMEAANRGASEVEGAITAGIAISLPFESSINKYCTPEASLLHHYFFTRKLALVQSSRALVVTAGGWGSLDELFEVLTLLQTGKVEHAEHYPVVLYPGSYWRKVVNFDIMVEGGVIASHDMNRLLFTDNIDEAFTYITEKLLKWEAAVAETKKAAAKAAENLPRSPAAAAYDAKVKAYLQARKAAGEGTSPVASSPVPAGGAGAQPGLASIAVAGGVGGFDVVSPVPLPHITGATTASPATGVVSPLGAK
jgi:uncharacterized protein (TIGR00730 family)